MLVWREITLTFYSYSYIWGTNVKYVRIGQVSSRDELLEVARGSATKELTESLAEAIGSTANGEERGFPVERQKWDRVDDGRVDRVDEFTTRLPDEDEVGGVYVFRGKMNRGGVTIWVAIKVASNDERRITLLKTVDDFGGGERQEEGLVADALDRLKRGVEVDG